MQFVANRGAFLLHFSPPDLSFVDRRMHCRVSLLLPPSSSGDRDPLCPPVPAVRAASFPDIQAGDPAGGEDENQT